MLVVMQQGATQPEIDRVVQTIEEMGYEARPMPGAQRTTVGLVGKLHGMRYVATRHCSRVPMRLKQRGVSYPQSRTRGRNCRFRYFRITSPPPRVRTKQNVF